MPGGSAPRRAGTTFDVAGHPITQGSKRAFRTPSGQVVLVEARAKKLADWRRLIADAARQGSPAGWPLLGPVAVELHFWMVRPASHPKRRQTWPTGARTGDVDKLARAALDALAGVAYLNDAQVVDLHVIKTWAPTSCSPGVEVTVTEAGL